ncbi:hypothetical protein CCY99_00920 [Helicobacter sp. 16-1353]|uniref:GGDEF domain-containing protein n=1 Tax=Helicobacter sp. 16-1353 TaxID=2004996 RepID=UPI000DCD5D19|nr:diguanylate cyclase [Helicobacter sp. 16-1353]RAX55293.1 hypothetical protein CCY99_00920 [Helicobacter sp. 16-1353]
MIRLQKNESNNIESLEELNEKDIDLDNLNIDENPSDTNEDSMQQGSLDSFSNEVLKELINKNIPPLPSNYQTFFEQMLNNCDLDFQKKIYDLMEADTKNDDRNIIIEKNIHLAFVKTKDLLKCTSSIYKNFIFMSETQHKLLTHSTDNMKFLQETKQIQEIIDKQIGQLKLLYQQCNKVLENININTMYDSKFDVYNKRYFIQLVQEEALAVQKFQHTSTILMMTLPYSVTQYLNNDQMAIIIMKTVAKLLLKTSRRSDMIGYIGNGIFGMLLKHSNIFSSKKASERLVELLKNTNIFIGNNEINLDLNIGIAKITPTRSAENALNYAISALRLAQKTKVEYVIYKEDVE